MSLNIDAIAKRIDELENDSSISPARRDLMMRAAMLKGHIPTEFLLAHGRDYKIGPDSFALPRGEAKQCYMNAAHLAVDNPALTYVEGKVACHGIALDHAWCVDSDGIVHDPTVRVGHENHISDYFGVPFRTAYLRKALLWNKYYGLLDYFVARKTAPKLYELGLDAGQRWLIDQPQATTEAAQEKGRQRGGLKSARRRRSARMPMSEMEYFDMQEQAEIGRVIAACAKAIFDAYDASTMAELQRTIYKYTDCGPAVSFELHDGVGGSPYVYVGDGRARTIAEPWKSIRQIGVSSIVEGSDAEVPLEWIDLSRYCDEDKYEADDLAVLAEIALTDFNKLVDRVNGDACALWDEANVDEK